MCDPERSEVQQFNWCHPERSEAQPIPIADFASLTSVILGGVRRSSLTSVILSEVRRSRTESKDPYSRDHPLNVVLTGLSYQPLLRSFHCGFVVSISEIFFSLIHPFNCFSRWIAAKTSPYVSK